MNEDLTGHQELRTLQSSSFRLRFFRLLRTTNAWILVVRRTLSGDSLCGFATLREDGDFTQRYKGAKHSTCRNRCLAAIQFSATHFSVACVRESQLCAWVAGKAHAVICVVKNCD